MPTARAVQLLVSWLAPPFPPAARILIPSPRAIDTMAILIQTQMVSRPSGAVGRGRPNGGFWRRGRRSGGAALAGRPRAISLPLQPLAPPPSAPRGSGNGPNSGTPTYGRRTRVQRCRYAAWRKGYRRATGEVCVSMYCTTDNDKPQDSISR